MGLVGFLTLWVKDIVIIFVLISIIEIIIPKGNMKKYIDMIMGFLIIIIIISPFVKLIHKNLNIDKNILRTTREEMKWHNDNELSRIQQEQMKKIYTEKLEFQIRELIYENTSYEVESIKIYIYEDEELYGSVKDMEISLKKKQTQKRSDGATVKVDNIEEISVGNKKEINTSVSRLEDKKIQGIISSEYNIPKENIKIFLKTLEGDELNEQDDR